MKSYTYGAQGLMDFMGIPVSWRLPPHMKSWRFEQKTENRIIGNLERPRISQPFQDTAFVSTYLQDIYSSD